MPPPPGYLRFADLVERLDLSPNTVRRRLEEMANQGTPIEPYRSGTMALYTEEQAVAIERFAIESHSLTVGRD